MATLNGNDFLTPSGTVLVKENGDRYLSISIALDANGERKSPPDITQIIDEELAKYPRPSVPLESTTPPSISGESSATFSSTLGSNETLSITNLSETKKSRPEPTEEMIALYNDLSISVVEEIVEEHKKQVETPLSGQDPPSDHPEAIELSMKIKKFMKQARSEIRDLSPSEVEQWRIQVKNMKGRKIKNWLEQRRKPPPPYLHPSSFQGPATRSPLLPDRATVTPRPLFLNIPKRTKKKYPAPPPSYIDPPIRFDPASKIGLTKEEKSGTLPIDIKEMSTPYGVIYQDKRGITYEPCHLELPGEVTPEQESLEKTPFITHIKAGGSTSYQETNQGEHGVNASVISDPLPDSVDIPEVIPPGEKPTTPCPLPDSPQQPTITALSSDPPEPPSQNPLGKLVLTQEDVEELKRQFEEDEKISTPDEAGEESNTPEPEETPLSEEPSRTPSPLGDIVFEFVSPALKGNEEPPRTPSPLDKTSQEPPDTPDTPRHPLLGVKDYDPTPKEIKALRKAWREEGEPDEEDEEYIDLRMDGDLDILEGEPEMEITSPSPPLDPVVERDLLRGCVDSPPPDAPTLPPGLQPPGLAKQPLPFRYGPQPVPTPRQKRTLPPGHVAYTDRLVDIPFPNSAPPLPPTESPGRLLERIQGLPFYEGDREWRLFTDEGGLRPLAYFEQETGEYFQHNSQTFSTAPLQSSPQPLQNSNSRPQPTRDSGTGNSASRRPSPATSAYGAPPNVLNYLELPSVPPSLTSNGRPPPRDADRAFKKPRLPEAFRNDPAFEARNNIPDWHDPGPTPLGNFSNVGYGLDGPRFQGTHSGDPTFKRIGGPGIICSIWVPRIARRHVHRNPLILRIDNRSPWNPQYPISQGFYSSGERVTSVIQADALAIIRWHRFELASTRNAAIKAVLDTSCPQELREVVTNYTPHFLDPPHPQDISYYSSGKHLQIITEATASKFLVTPTLRAQRNLLNKYVTTPAPNRRPLILQYDRSFDPFPWDGTSTDPEYCDGEPFGLALEFAPAVVGDKWDVAMRR